MGWKEEILKKYTDEELDIKADIEYTKIIKGEIKCYMPYLGMLAHREFYKAIRKEMQTRLKDE